MDIASNTLLAGTFLLIAGMFGLIRHFLLEPTLPNYPKAPQWLLHVFFLFAAALIYIGLRFLNAWYVGEATTIPPAAPPMMVLLSFMILFYKGALLINVLRQRLPAETWTRLNRITARAHCWPRPGA